jgi:hypothetical protein
LLTRPFFTSRYQTCCASCAVMAVHILVVNNIHLY